MIYNKYNALPNDLLKVGYNLEFLGISEIAWKYEDVLKVIDFLANRGYIILGGDVYSYDEKGIESTYDSWYANKTISGILVEESRIKAFEYISGYTKNNGCNYIYSIIFDTK